MLDMLQELNDIFEEVKDKDSMFEQLPDGEYLAKIIDLEAKESQKGLPMVVITFEILEGEHKGESHYQYLMLSGNDEKQLRGNIHRYATTIKKLGIDTNVKSIDETFAQFGKALNTEVKLIITTTVSKKNGNSYTNTSFEPFE